MKAINILIRSILIISVAMVAASCAVNPVTGQRQLMLMTEEQEIAMGVSYDPQVMATFGEYPDPEIQSFVQTKGTEMGKISHRPNLEYHIKVVDSPVVNAFAVPGGYIYLTRGILAQLNNEAELIGVLGHEMGHITARHSVSQQSKQQLGALLIIGGMIVAPRYAEYADYAMQSMQLLFLKFSRDDERQADALGVEYSSKIGYDAHKMADFFEVLNKMNMASSHGGVPTFLSTHPDPGDRNISVNQSATAWQEKLKLPSWKINSDSYLRMIDGIVYGEDPRQGFVEANTFYHPEMKFKFSFPAGWQFENMPVQVNMAPKDGNALMVFTVAQGNSLGEAARNTIQQLELSLTESRDITVNGMPAVATISKQVSQDQNTGQQMTLMVSSCFIQYESRYFVFHGLTTDTDFSTYRQSFEATMSTFSRLTDPAKLNIQPYRIKVRQVQRTGTLAEAFASFGVKQDKMAELALLNNLELTDRVQAGKLIKIVGK